MNDAFIKAKCSLSVVDAIDAKRPFSLLLYMGDELFIPPQGKEFEHYCIEPDDMAEAEYDNLTYNRNIGD